MFCFKCLKACVDVLANSKDVPDGLNDVVYIITECLVKCFGSNNKIPHLCCEKVLFHLVKGYYTKKCYDEQLRIAQLLQTLLRSSSSNQTSSLHKNIMDMLWRTAGQLNQSENSLLCLQLRCTAISSMIDAGCSEHVVMENIVKCSNWYRMTSSGSHDSGSHDSHHIFTFYSNLDQCLRHDMELNNMSIFLCHYCQVCYGNNEMEMAEECLKRLSNLSVNHSSLLEGIVILIRTCHFIDNHLTADGIAEENSLTNNLNKVAIKLKALRKNCAVLSAVTFVVEWLNKLLSNFPCSFTSEAFTCINNLQDNCYLPFVCNKKKMVVYKILLSLSFAQVKHIVECDDSVDDKILQQSTKQALSIISKAEKCCNSLG